MGLEAREERTLPRKPGSRAVYACLAVALVVLTVAVYLPAIRGGFLKYDDSCYVTANPHVRAGLTSAGLAWVWTASVLTHWHPLTMISHMLDVQLFGLRPGFHHLTNVLMHVAITLLLMLFLTQVTGRVWASAFTAALFAVHPLHVESVAWISGRKDVLSTLFWILAMLAYARYAAKPTLRRYVPVFLLFALGLAAKSMLVTLPVVLLLLDYWPLGRFGRTGIRRLLLEKLPLLGLSIASAAVALVFMARAEMVGGLKWMPLTVRLANAVVAYVTYLRQTIWPTDLAAFYPHPEASLPVWQVVLSAAILAVITAWAIRGRKTRPYVLTGWLWYLVTLLPVIGILQVGMQSRADRYTYVPLIGVFFAIAWGVAEFSKTRARDAVVARRALGIMGAAAVLILSALANVQARYWQDEYTLFEHALRVTRDNYVAHGNLGLQLRSRGREELALLHFRKAVRISPAYPEAHFNIAAILADRNRNREAVAHYRQGLKWAPGDSRAHHYLAGVLAKLGRTAEALAEYKIALNLDPRNPRILFDLGDLESNLGRYEDALKHLREAVKLKPGFATAHNNIGAVLFKLQRYSEAAVALTNAIRAKPDSVEMRANLAVAYYSAGEYAKAWEAVRDCAAHGGKMPPGFVRDLSRRMREPAD
jgi:protein O-mannosyl-transferase